MLPRQLRRALRHLYFRVAKDLRKLVKIAAIHQRDFPSGDASNSGAMAAILGFVFEDNPGVPIVVTIAGIRRQWSSFEGVEEVIDARVYSEIHFGRHTTWPADHTLCLDTGAMALSEWRIRI